MKQAVSIFLAYLLIVSHGLGNELKRAQFSEVCLERLSDSRVLQGEEPNWFFSGNEIRHLSLGKFWEKPWEKVTRNRSNPIPAIVEFHRLLQEKNVELLIVPIPAKATIYPEKFAGGFSPGEAPGISPFVQILRKKGLNVLDLEPFFLEQRKKGSLERYWCEQDAHFSPLACVRIADIIADRLKNDCGIEPIENPELVRSEEKEIKIVGDLVAFSSWENAFPKETLRVQYVGNPKPVTSDVNSPILLLGDSHTLVFSDALSFHCEGAGLFDHLSSAMGRALDLEGNASGGLITSRINLFRKAVAHPGYWNKKKAVVWVFTAREFTQNSYKRGFISVPIER